MPMPRRSGPIFRPSLPFICLLALLCSLWIAGGASRADALGQTVVRTVATLALVATALFGEKPIWRGASPIAALLGASVLLALLQLLPLPPSIWQTLPGRSMFAEPFATNNLSQPWRPLAIVPGGAINAAASLIVPVATLILVTQLRPAERSRLPTILLSMISASMLVALLQLSGIGFDNPLINDSAGQISGTFANRNHLALFLAIGCLLAPAWAFGGQYRLGWRAPTALAMVTLFALTMLASGSRAGLLLGAMALAMGLLLVLKEVRAALRHYPRWVFPALILGMILIVTIFVLISVAADRAVSINRLLAADTGEDMRTRALPTVLSMIAFYFPAGSGLGSFDPLFRMHEPFALLKRTYFNHAHNDWLELVLDTGILGLLLLITALCWWGLASARAWKRRIRGSQARLGSAILLLVMVASAFDYPARTPTMMAMVVIAAMWLARDHEPIDDLSARPERTE